MYGVLLFLLATGLVSSSFIKTSQDVRSKAAETRLQRLTISNGPKSQIVNVKYYGARGDGSNNDTSAILKAVKAAGPNSTVFFPPGNYLISDRIIVKNSDMEIYGSGATITQTSWQSVFYSEANIDRIYLHDLKFNNTYQKRSPAGPTIYMINNPTNITVERVIVDNSLYNGIAIGSPAGSSSADNIIIRNSRISNPLDAGIQLAGRRVLVEGNYISGSPFNGIDSNATDTTIKNNYLVGNGTATSDVDTTARNGIFVGSQVSNVIIEGNTSLNNGNAGRPGDGINVTLTNVQRAIISGNIVAGNTRNGIQASGFRFVITGNIVQNNGTPGKVDWGIVSDGAYSVISNNVLDNNHNRGIMSIGDYSRIENNTVKDSLIGINVGDKPSNLTIADNTIIKNGTPGEHGIFIEGKSASETQIYRNLIKGYVNAITDFGINTNKANR